MKLRRWEKDWIPVQARNDKVGQRSVYAPSPEHGRLKAPLPTFRAFPARLAFLALLNATNAMDARRKRRNSRFAPLALSPLPLAFCP